MDAERSPRRPGRLSRWLVAALFISAAALALWVLAPQTLGETARRQFVQQLQAHYADFDVSIGRGTYQPEVGLIFEDVVIAESAASAEQFQPRQLVSIERMTVVADIEPEKLLDQQSPLTTHRIVLDGVTANAWFDADGKLSLNRLLPMPQFGPCTPVLHLREAKLRLMGSNPRQRPVEALLTSVVIESHPQLDGGVDKQIVVHGRTDFAEGFAIKCNLHGDTIDFRSNIQNAHLSRDLFERLPSHWREPIREARDLDCTGDASLAWYRSVSGTSNYRLRATLHEGRFSHSSLPRPLSELRGVIVADPSGITIEASHGRLGDAVVRLTGKVAGMSKDSPAKLKLSARGLLLDNQFASAIPTTMRTAWDRLQPLGRVDLDLDLSNLEARWIAEGSVVCKGVDVRYEKFPYPVEQLVGRVEIRDGRAIAESLDGRIGGSRMQCAFHLPLRAGTPGTKMFVLTTDGPVAIDSTLLQSLSPRGSPVTKLEQFVRSLRPRGSVHVTSAMLATDASGNQIRKMELRIAGGHVRYEKFDYPLYNVEGTIQVEDELVKLIGFRATNANAGVVHCDGGYQMPTDPDSAASYRISDVALANPVDSVLSLQFKASDVPLDDSLRSSLPPTARHTWDALSPGGVLDDLTVTVGQHGAGNPLLFDVIARQNSRGQVSTKTLNLRPGSFPYRLDVTDGLVRFDGSRVIIDSITARHDDSILSADGGCVQRSDGRWELSLNLHSGSRLHPDRELIAATPNQIREAMRRLQLRGPVSLRGRSRLLLSDQQHPEPEVDWNLVLQLEGNRIGDVGPVHSLRGELSVEGSRDPSGVRASGEVRIDSLHVYDLQITSIQGPFSIDGDRLRLGGGPIDRGGRVTLADIARQDSNASIIGRLFDGNLKLDGEMILSRASFDVDFAIGEAQIETVLAEYGYGDSDLTGACSGKVQLQGTLGSSELLKGDGAARLSGANLYQLPLIVQLLNQLRVTPTEAVAFTDGELEFTVFGDQYTFNEMQLWGDLVALHGGGTMDRRHEVDLTFNTRVSPQNTFTQVFRPLRSQQYTLWTIDVRGPIGSPDIQRRSFEGVGETLDYLLRGVSPPKVSDGQGGWMRSWLR